MSQNRVPTNRQIEVLMAIHMLTTDMGYPPTIRELGVRLQVSSLRGVTVQLDSLQHKGMVKRAPYIARSVRLTPAGFECIGVKTGGD